MEISFLLFQQLQPLVIMEYSNGVHKTWYGKNSFSLDMADINSYMLQVLDPCCDFLHLSYPPSNFVAQPLISPPADC